MTGCSLSCLALGKNITDKYVHVVLICNPVILGAYAYNFIPPEWSSFDKHEPIAVDGNINYIPMILFFTLAFFSNVGVTPIPWILLSEVFPFKYVTIEPEVIFD